MTVDGEEQQQPVVADTADAVTDDTPKLKRPYDQILDECAGTFVDCLKPTRDLLNFLATHQVFNAEMVQKILCRPNRGDRVGQLLQFLKLLGPQSFLAFVNALKNTEQIYLANILTANIIEPCSSA